MLVSELDKVILIRYNKAKKSVSSRPLLNGYINKMGVSRQQVEKIGDAIFYGEAAARVRHPMRAIN